MLDLLIIGTVSHPQSGTEGHHKLWTFLLCGSADKCSLVQ